MLALLALIAVPLLSPPEPCWTRANAVQLEHRVSPLDSTTVALGDDSVKVCYGSPSIRGRKIMGKLVPYNEPWRLGANEATTISVPFAVQFAGMRLDAGMYSLYVVPIGGSWKIYVNRNAKRWGIPIDNGVRNQDIASHSVRTEQTRDTVQALKMTFTPPEKNASELVIEWETTRVRLPIQRTKE
jgi:hypothetical protein